MTPQLIFISEFGEREAYQAASRGYLSRVLVKLDSGQLFPVVFYDAVRLKQDLDVMLAQGEDFIGDPGMIVVREVTLDVINVAVQKLAKQGYFEHLVPTTMELVNASHGEWPPSRNTR